MIYSSETERHCIAGAMRHPDILSEVSFFVKEEDFNPKSSNRIIYSAILDALKKGEDVSSFRISEKLVNAGIKLSDLDVNPGDYLEELKLISINEKATLQAFKELKKVSIRRAYHELGRSMSDMMKHNSDKTIDEIIQEADNLYGGNAVLFDEHSDELVEDVFADMEQIIEERGNNPITDFGAKGPFKRVNEIYGSLLRRGNTTVVAARTGQGKTQLGMYYLMRVLKEYKMPILHLDMGEMSKFEIQMRLATLLTGGKVSPSMLEEGTWRKNPETVKLVRAAWPHVQELQEYYFYKDVSEMSPDQMISLMKRFYLTKVKHRNKKLEDGLEFFTFYDYIKAFENNDKGTSKMAQEYQLIGNFFQKAKRTVQRVLPTNFTTSLQTNRIGITGNKSTMAIDDTENIFGMSDRIIQQATHGAILRRKTNEELAAEPGLGNYYLIFRKFRHLGPDRDAATIPVRMPDGTLRDNLIMLENKNFIWKEVGDLSQLKDAIGILPTHSHGANDNNDNDNPPDVARRRKESADLD